MVIRQYHEQDWPLLWPLLKHEFSTGETYPYPQDISEEESQSVWVHTPLATYVMQETQKAHDARETQKAQEARETQKAQEAQDDASIQAFLGTYYIKSNQCGAGAHVCNCGYIVNTGHRDRGIGTALYHDSVVQAMTLGYRAMQFNLVVSTNERSVHLWQKLGMHVVGVLPHAFKSPRKGYVDALVMYRELY